MLRTDRQYTVPWLHCKKGACTYTGTAQIFWVPPIISGTGKATDFNFGQYIHRVHPNKSPLKILGEKGAWAYTGTAQIFWVPLIISGTGKATNCKFCRLNQNKSPLKILGKVAMGVVMASQNFSGHPYIWRIARSGHLCDSSDFLL